MNHLLLTVIADGETHNNGPDFGKASPLGLLIVVLLVVATVFLVRSMNRQLKKVPKSFDRPNPEADQAAHEGAAVVDGVEHQPPGPDGDGPARPPGSAHEPG